MSNTLAVTHTAFILLLPSLCWKSYQAWDTKQLELFHTGYIHSNATEASKQTHWHICRIEQVCQVSQFHMHCSVPMARGILVQYPNVATGIVYVWDGFLLGIMRCSSWRWFLPSCHNSPSPVTELSRLAVQPLPICKQKPQGFLKYL